MATSPINWATVGADGKVTSPTPKSTTSGTESLATRDTFMKLLMAQVRNQNPLQPTDGVQFLTQLAQFSSLEQNLQMSNTLTSIKNTLDQLATGTTGTSRTGK